MALITENENDNDVDLEIEKIRNIGCWFVQCQVGDDRLFGLMDSGSDHCLMGIEIFNLLSKKHKGRIMAT